MWCRRLSYDPSPHRLGALHFAVGGLKASLEFARAPRQWGSEGAALLQLLLPFSRELGVVLNGLGGVPLEQEADLGLLLYLLGSGPVEDRLWCLVHRLKRLGQQVRPGPLARRAEFGQFSFESLYRAVYNA